MRCAARPASTRRAMPAPAPTTPRTTRACSTSSRPCRTRRAPRATAARWCSCAGRSTRRRWCARRAGKGASRACRAARGGFGYDPLFLVGDGERTAAELDPARKNEVSHRGTGAARAGRGADGAGRRIVSRAAPPLSLYVHLPWCVRKCPYCDFNSHAVPARGVPEQAYLAALLDDLEFAARGCAGRAAGVGLLRRRHAEPVLGRRRSAA